MAWSEGGAAAGASRRSNRSRERRGPVVGSRDIYSRVMDRARCAVPRATSGGCAAGNGTGAASLSDYAGCERALDMLERKVGVRVDLAMAVGCAWGGIFGTGAPNLQPQVHREYSTQLDSCSTFFFHRLLKRCNTLQFSANIDATRRRLHSKKEDYVTKV